MFGCDSTRMGSSAALAFDISDDHVIGLGNCTCRMIPENLTFNLIAKLIGPNKILGDVSSVVLFKSKSTARMKMGVMFNLYNMIVDD